MGFFIQGLLIGFSIAAPVGPIGILCIQRTIHHSRVSGFVTGLGAATADAFYGAVAAFGLTAISSFLTGGQFWLRLIGGTFLAVLAIKTLLSRPPMQPGNATHKGLLSDYATTVLLTLMNPSTILSFLAVFAGLGLGGTNGDLGAATSMVAGVFLGSAAWWLFLSWGVGMVRSRFDAGALRATNILSGLILLGFAAAAFASVF